MARELGEGQTKKLIEAAEHWAGGGVVDESHDDAAAFGLDLPEQASSDDFEVWPENWDAVLMFLRISTQWRTSMGGPIGLDYGALEWLFRLYEVTEPRSLLEDLQVMEGAALTAMSKEG
jgi:hypothetical protein